MLNFSSTTFTTSTNQGFASEETYTLSIKLVKEGINHQIVTLLYHFKNIHL